jgi:hypothetical protein
MSDVIAPEYPPSEETLKAKALRFLRTCRAKEYRELSRSGDLPEAVSLKVKGAQDYAQSLMATGVWETEAWNRAIRSEILESESD